MIQVFFESETHAQWIATFQDEYLYNKCLPVLKAEALSLGLKLTESVIADY